MQSGSTPEWLRPVLRRRLDLGGSHGLVELSAKLIWFSVRRTRVRAPPRLRARHIPRETSVHRAGRLRAHACHFRTQLDLWHARCDGNGYFNEVLIGSTVPGKAGATCRTGVIGEHTCLPSRGGEFDSLVRHGHQVPGVKMDPPGEACVVGAGRSLAHICYLPWWA